MLLLQELQVGNLITSQPSDNIFSRQQVHNLGTLLPILFQLIQDLLPLQRKLLGSIVHTLQLTVQSCHVIRHVRLFQQLVLRPRHIQRWLIFLFCDELQQRED